MYDNCGKTSLKRPMILGSSSPRRKEILQFFSIPFIQVSPDFDEECIPFLGDPKKYAMTLAESKADCLKEKFCDEIVITADTVVYLDGKIYNKPKDIEEARRFLRELSGKKHEVITGVCVSKGPKKISQYQSTYIQFHTLGDEQIELYLSHFAFSDKAGGYAIQQGGGIIVSHIEGCYYNVMGLPLNTLCHLLKEFQIDLWKHLKIF